MANPPRNKSDFDATELLATNEQHEKNISDLTGRISKIEGHLSTPQALAAFLEKSAADSRNLEAVFAQMFCRFLKENQDVQGAVKKKVDEIDRNFFYERMKRFGFLIYSGFMILVGIAGKEICHWLFSLIGNR